MQLNELQTDNKNKKIRDLYSDINEFKKALKGEKEDGLTNTHTILNRRKYHLSFIKCAWG